MINANSDHSAVSKLRQCLGQSPGQRVHCMHV